MNWAGLAAAALSLASGSALAVRSVAWPAPTSAAVFLAFVAVVALQRFAVAVLGAPVIVGSTTEGTAVAAAALLLLGQETGVKAFALLLVPVVWFGQPLLALALLPLWYVALREHGCESTSPWHRFASAFRDRVAVVWPGVPTTAVRDLVLARAFAALAPETRAAFETARDENGFALGFLGPFVALLSVSEMLPPWVVSIGFGVLYAFIAAQ